MKRILVTGGAGFLGSHLCDRLLEEGDEIIALDNFYTGRRENLAHRSEDPRLELVRHDIVEPFYTEVDEIYHLACPASPVHYQRNPVRTMKVGFQGTLNVLELARDVGARVLIASTSEIYGDPEQHPQAETYWGHVNPVGPRACYDESKRIAETLTRGFAAQYAVDARIMRIFNTYGPRMNEADGRVVSNFVLQALRGEALTIYGRGEQTRSFCYVDDLIEGMVRLMATTEDPGPVNLGNPEELTMKQLAELVLELTGSASGLAYRGLPVDDPTRRRPDIGKAREVLGWSPGVSVRQGLEATIAYFRERLRRRGASARPTAVASYAQAG